MKRVLLIVVDACTPRVLAPLLESGRLPTIARLADRGSVSLDCVSIFPSITPAATTTIVTGHYPREHGIAGMSWFDAATGGVTYFGDDVWTIARRGFGDLLRNFLLRLNDELLRAPTIFETVEAQGLSAGCFNHLIFKGLASHTVKTPWLLRLLPSVPSELTVRGPSTLCLGGFVSDTPRTPSPSTNGSAFHRFGLDDDGTAGFLLNLGGLEALPDFSVAYFADNDFQSHKHGPGDAADTLEHVDELLGRVFDAWGGVDRVLDDLCVVLTADHSQSDVGAGQDAGIRIEDLLPDWSLADPASGWQGDQELMVCPNMRAAEVYVKRPADETVRRVVAALVADPRIDQVLWRDPAALGGPCHVSTRDRGELSFEPADAGGGVDRFGGRWRWQGSLAALDLRQGPSGTLEDGAYPNAFERIAAGIGRERGGPIWVTARLGHEFEVTGQDPHRGGGSHGSLHVQDSLVPLLVAGAPDGVTMPTAPRLVDVTPICLRALGLEGAVAPGASRARGGAG